jgi:hypothetical protein
MLLHNSNNIKQPLLKDEREQPLLPCHKQLP